MPSKVPQFTLRINPKLLTKLRYIAEFNGRSANKEVEVLIKRHVETFEKSQGKIPDEEL